MRLTFLGTGTSGGIPMINCNCSVCRSDNPKNKRLRCSIMIEVKGLHILVDTAPDLRQQFLRQPFPKIDAVLFTHSHADHIFGLDDLRRFNYIQQAPIPVYGNPETIQRLQTIFDYAFVKTDWHPGRPNLTAAVIEQPFHINDVFVIPVPLNHGKQQILGYRIGNFAYCTDVSHIPAESYALLSGLEILILDALREKAHPTHFNLQQALSEAQKINARQTYFTHMSHKIDHEKHGALLPANMAFAYDGLALEV